MEESGIDVTTSHDVEILDSVSLNCISKVSGISKALFSQAANSVFSIATEETVETNGIIDEVLERRQRDIHNFEKT